MLSPREVSISQSRTPAGLKPLVAGLKLLVAGLKPRATDRAEAPRYRPYVPAGLKPLVAGLKPRATERAKAPRYERMKFNTSSRFCSMRSGRTASRFSRSIGSVFEARTLKCQSGYSAEMPSSEYTRPS